MMQILNPKRIQIIYQCCNKKSYKISTYNFQRIITELYQYLLMVLYKLTKLLTTCCVDIDVCKYMGFL